MKPSQSRNAMREKVINYLYYFQLFETEINDTKAFEDEDFSPQELKIISSIAEQNHKFVAIAKKFLGKKWTWTRIAPLQQAIIIYGAFELTFHDKALVINELVKITKKYTIGDEYKFINGILDNIGAYYEKMKASQNRPKK